MKHSTFQRFLALLLCFAMLLPNLTGLASAAGTGSTGAPQSVTPDKEWVHAADPFASGEIPKFTTVGSVSDTLLCDGGNGMVLGRSDENKASSYMRIVTNTNALEAAVFASALIDAGFKRTAYRAAQSSTNGQNTFYRFLSPKGDYVLVVCHIASYKETRLIVDTAEDIVNDFAGGFVYKSTTGEVAQPMIAMYGQSMSPNGYDNTTTTDYNTGARNCGALIVIRMPDNSLFINDGGDIEQWSDEVCADFMKFCRELTGKKEGETVVINTWFISHAHSDHFDGLPRFIYKYYDAIDIRNVMYNIDDECLISARDMSMVLQMVKGYFPNANYYKPHTGDFFDIAGVEFEVLYTQEDRFLPDANGHLDTGRVASKYRPDGTYRECLIDYDAMENEGLDYPLYDFNDTSAVLKVNFPADITAAAEDRSMILYADVNFADEIIMQMWPASALATDIMMVPHHGHDPHPELVAMSGASIFLYTQAKSAIYGPNGKVDYKVNADGTITYSKVDPAGTYRPALVNNFLLMHDIEGEKYFDTTANRKTYWEGTETACILFGENTEFENQPSGLTRDSQDPTGYTVYTAAVQYFPYGGWTSTPVIDPAYTTTNKSVSTTTSKIRLEQVTDGTLTMGEKYVIVHDKSDNILMYDPIPLISTQERANPPYSMQVTVGNTGDSDAYFSADEETLYLSHSDRNEAMWLMERQEGTDPTIYTTSSSNKPILGGNATYRRYLYHKGLTTQDAYWTATDASSVIFRRLQPNSANVILSTTETANYNTYTEFFDDGTCVIYYVNSFNTKDITTIRFLVRNEDGTWAQKSYTCTAGKWSTLKNTVLADLDDLKLRLYKYEEQSAKENLSVTGPSSVNALQGAAQDALLYEVAGTLTVKDSAGLAVPYSGTEKVVGSYYMVYDEATSKATAYYYNDDATSTALATVTVNQRSSINLYAEYSDDDTTHAGTKYGSKYGFLYLGSNTIYEEVVNHTNLMDMMVTRLESDASGNITMKAQNVPLTPAMLTYANGQAVDFSTPGVYSGLVLNYNGDVVDIGFTVQVAGSVNDLRTPAEGEEGHVDAGKQSTTTHEQFLQSGVANIELSANGIPVTKGIDLIIVMDLSGSMKNGLDTNTDAPNYEDSRLYALEESLRSVIENLRSSGADIRIAMSDFGDIDHFEFDGAAMIEEFRDRAFYDVNMNNDLNRAYEFYNHLNFVITRDENGVVDQGAGPYGVIDKKFNLAHCSYTGRVVPTVYTGSGMVGADAFVDIGDLNDAVMNGIVAKMDENLTKSLGTNYDIGLEYAYQLGYSITKANESAGEDRELVCIFMSDGAAMQYNYFSGNGQSTGWEEWLTGEIDDVQSVADHYADEENWPEELEEISRVLLELLVAETVDENYANGPYSQLQTYNYRSRSSQEYFRFYTDKVQEGYNYQYFFTYMDHQQYQLDWDFLQRLAKANGISDLVYDGSGYSYTYNGQSYVHDRVLQPLIDLFTDKSGGLQQTTDENPRSFYVSKLVNPDYRDGCRENNQTEDRLLVSQPKFYKQYTGTVDDSVSYTKQFFAAMESIGVEMNWDEFAKIAWKNTDELEAALDPDNTDGMNTTALRQLIASAKTPLGTENGVWQTLSPYDYFYNTEGKSWWAEALKGDADKLYPVINKYAHADNAQWNNAYYGDVRNHFTTGTGLELDGQDYISGFRGLDMELYTVSFSVADDNNLKADTAEQVLKNIASGPSYFFAANTREDLTGSLETIISSMDRAAGSAFYVDTMGEYFDLSTEKIVTVNDGSQVIVNADPSIRVLQYELDANGNRLPNAVVREKVTFEDMDGDGDTDAWSNMVYTTVTQDGVITQVYKDIWNENTGIISARYFYYNANTAGTNKDLNGDGVLDVNAGDVVDGVYKLDITGDGVGDYRLAPETFFWIIGVIGSDELVLEYQVYLTGSFDNLERLGGTYATNASATLTYTNYLGMTYTSQSPTSPVQEWGQAKIGYAYYLVNADGQPITADGTVTNIIGAQKITSPVVRDLEWNHRTSIAAKTNFREVPAGYKLYAPDAEYLLRANSTGNGYWMIQQDATGTTYVQYPDAVYNNGTSNNTMTNGEYGDTIVWFAVKVADGGLTLDKTVEQTGEYYTLTLDAFANDMKLDDGDVLKEVLSDYFDLVGGVNADIKVYTARFNADGTTGTPVLFEGAKVTVGKTDESADRYDLISVSGFDYGQEYYYSLPRIKDGQEYYGSKLIVKVPVQVREGFWGGNNVPTNEDTTAVYDVTYSGSAVVGEEPVSYFPIPHVNVPVLPVIQAQDQVVYYGETGITGADLLTGGISVGGVAVSNDLKPAESWMDDYATLTWASGSATAQTVISGTASSDNRFTLVLKPTDAAAAEVGEKVPAEGYTVSDTGSVKVLVPVYTFNDTTVPMGHIPVLNEENLTSGPIWVDLNTGLPGVASDPDSAPTMELVYNTTGAILEETPVQVTVNCTNPDGSKVDIMDAVTFHWVACHDSKHHSDSENVATHLGSANSIEFTIHVGVAQEDSVVIDFGLSVDIKPLTNDTLADIKLVGVYAERPEDLTAPFAAEATGKYGVLRLESESAVRYTLSGGNAMQMRTADRFYCVIAYTLGGKTVYDCAQLSVIPATTIYYEDSFIDFSVVETDDLAGLKDKVTSGGWTDVYDEEPKDLNDAVQSEDRPGEGLNDVDPNSIYGYDSVYASMAQYSLGSAKKIHVFSRKDADGNQFVKTGRATFTFSGTGFDVISLTSNTSGTLMVRLYEVDENGVASDTIYKTLLVDTYYGYAYGDSDGDGDEEWYVDADAENALYQVPVMKVSDLPYGTYKAVISASYNKFFDHDQYGDSSYDFYLDAIRIYDPAKGDETAEGAHEQDGEGWPTYQELRDLLISAADADKLEDTAVNGAIFIDGKTGALSISDYRNYGPNNELYLMPGQSIAFDLNLDTVTANMAAVHMGIKSVGGLAKAQIYAVGQGEKLDLTVNSATDLFYDLTELNGCTVVISNVGGEADAILSLTNIKTTYHSDPSAVVMRSVFSMRRSSANAVLASLTNEEQLPTLTLRGASIALKDEVMYNVFFDVENAAGLELVEMGMLTWSSKPETVSVALADQVMPGVTYNSTTGWYKARSQGVPAKNLADDISMAVYAKLADGRYVYSPAVDYSAEKYAYAILASEDYDAVSKAMAVALLEYGAAAQNYFGYKTEDLMNADLTDEMRKYLDGYTTDSIMDPILADADKVEAFAATGGFSEMAASASFKGAFALKYYFRPANAVDENMTLYCWSEETYLSSEALTSENADRILTMDALAGGNYMAAYTDIAAKNMDDTVFVCAVYESDGIRYSTGVLPYSFGAYCRSGLTHESAEFRALAEATMIYCAAAKALFGVD